MIQHIKPQNGDLKVINNTPCIFSEGYWIRCYEPPHKQDESYAEKRYLIKMLTKRVFRNTEPGINTPGCKLDITRETYDNCQDTAQKRILAGMMAGALLNRAADILTHVVELQKDGVNITSQNELIRQCGHHLMEALELGKNVKHYSGAEGIDELWGEPFKAFSLPIDEFYKSRYQKIGLSMRMIDDIALLMNNVVAHFKPLTGLDKKINAFAETAKQVAETAKNDPVFINLWPKFIANGECLLNPIMLSEEDVLNLKSTLALLKSGKNLIQHISSARVTMPKSYNLYKIRCQQHLEDL